ncbi:MAG: L28 family ribosomal protein [bacterium]|nr:L28 family ribosomal protein [bacterium]
MAYSCDNCGKSVTIGNSQRHGRGVAGKRWKKRAPETPRTFRPNLQKITVLMSGHREQIRICTRCLKRLKKDGKLSKMRAVQISPATI